MKFTVTDTLDLPISERILLVEEIWKSIAEHPDEIKLSDATRQLLRRRLKDHLANPDAGSPWKEVKARIIS